jgi:hypothetical protein
MVADGSCYRPVEGRAHGKTIFAKALPVSSGRSHITVEGFNDGEDSRRHVAGSVLAMEIFCESVAGF